MTSVYNEKWIYNLSVIKETKRWAKQGLITNEQLKAIHAEYTVQFYHPNVLIRILLFVATLFALSGVTGLCALILQDLGEDGILTACILYGIVSFFILEQFFIKGNNHYKSGVTEALIYHACGYTILGFAGVTDFNTYVTLATCTIVLGYAGWRYLDLICTTGSFLSAAGLLFYGFYELGGIFQQIIPLIFLSSFTLLYFFIKQLKRRYGQSVWHYNLMICEVLSLLFIYTSGNYLVVRELSVALLELNLNSGEDIPFAWLFYILTVVIPVLYLYYGIKNKDIILIRVSLFVIAFSVFTFKFYFSLGHPEITLTIAGLMLIGISLLIFTYLRSIRYGYTRENLLSEKWGNVNVQAILFSQTLGGNQMPASTQADAGGEFGGGGATGSY